MIRFTIPVDSHGKKASVRVTVFETRRAMQQSIRRYHKRVGTHYPEAWYKNPAAVTTGHLSYKFPAGRSMYSADIRLNKEWLGSRVVSHEATHAAWWFYHEQIQKTVPDMEREEILCHLVSEITGQIVDELYERGCYERVS